MHELQKAIPDVEVLLALEAVAVTSPRVSRRCLPDHWRSKQF